MAAQPLDQLGFDRTVLALVEPHQQPVADAGRCHASLMLAGCEPNRRCGLAGTTEAYIEFAVDIAAHHISHAGRGQGPWRGDTLAPPLRQGAFAGQAPQHLAQSTPLSALHAKGASDLSEIGLAGLLDEAGQNLSVGQPRCVAMNRRRVTHRPSLTTVPGHGEAIQGRKVPTAVVALGSADALKPAEWTFWPQEPLNISFLALTLTRSTRVDEAM